MKIEDYLSRFPREEETVRNAFEEVQGCQKIDKYTLKRKIGAGGMGTVYLAEQEFTGQKVAVKIMRRILLYDTEAKSRFRNEMRSLGKLEHPNIISVKDANLLDETPFLVMEYVDGVTLDEYRSDYFAVHGTRFTPVYIQNITRFMLQVARGLQCIHENDLVHRDIKPLNIMLASDRKTIKILDLGLAKLKKGVSEHSSFFHQTHPQSTFGTLAFMSPEQFSSSRDADIRSDIYSLGRTFLFLLSEDAAIDAQYLHRKDIPKKIRTIIQKTLQKNPESRYQTPGELADDLAGYLQKTEDRKKASFFTHPAFLVIVILASFFMVFPAMMPFVWKTLFPVENKKVKDTVLKEGSHVSAESPEEKIHNAVQLRYQGDAEFSMEKLFELEDDIRNAPRNSQTDTLLATTIAARADALFFTDFASGKLSEKALKQLFQTYEKTIREENRGDPFFEVTVLLKQAMLEASLSGNNAKIEKMFDKSQMLKESILDEKKKEYVTLLGHLARGVTEIQESPRSLRRLVQHFELNDSLTLRSRENMELRLFAIEFLIRHDKANDSPSVKKDVESLDIVLFQAFDTLETARYLNRYFDLAICCTDKTECAKLTQYIRRMRPGTTAESERRLAEIGQPTQLLFYFSPNEKDGLAIYYPFDGDNASVFAIPYSRAQIKEIAQSGETIPLDEELLSLVWNDRHSGLAIMLSWNDTMCWPRRRDSIIYEDWPFDESITVEEIFGLMK